VNLTIFSTGYSYPQVYSKKMDNNNRDTQIIIRNTQKNFNH